MDDLCQEFDLAIANDDTGNINSYWTFRSSMGFLRRIDYVLFSRGLIKRAAYASNELDLGSDHRAVRAEFEFQRPAETKQSKA